jgi:cell division protein FtsN
MSEVINKNTDKRTALFYTEDVVLPKKQDTKGYKFYIIGGSFKKEVNAKQYIKQYKDKGFDIEILNVDGLYRVSLKSFDSKVKALHELRRIRNEEQNDKVWLLSYK